MHVQLCAGFFFLSPSCTSPSVTAVSECTAELFQIRRVQIDVSENIVPPKYCGRTSLLEETVPLRSPCSRIGVALLTGRRTTVYTSNYVMSIPAAAAAAAAAASTVSAGEATSLSQPQFADQTANREPTAFHRNKGKHAKSPERFFSAIKTPTPSPAPISGSHAASLSTPSQAPPLL